jgi:hypothetical protein
MDHIGIDVHKRESQIYILAEGGEIIEHRIRTDPERSRAKVSSPARSPAATLSRRSETNRATSCAASSTAC